MMRTAIILSYFQTNKKATSWLVHNCFILVMFYYSLVAEFIRALSRLEVADVKESTPLCNGLVDSCCQLNKSYEMWVITVKTR